MCRIVSEAEFSQAIRIELSAVKWIDQVDCVTGPGRSGAIAAVYASHILGIPFIPYGTKPPPQLPRLLLIDTASQTGKTIRKAQRKYEGHVAATVVVYQEPPRVAFWYEATKPQHYTHESSQIGTEPSQEGIEGLGQTYNAVGPRSRMEL